MKRHSSLSTLLAFALIVPFTSGCTRDIRMKEKAATGSGSYAQDTAGLTAPTGGGRNPSSTAGGVGAPTGSYSLDGATANQGNSAGQQEEVVDNRPPPISTRVGTVGYNEVKVTAQAKSVLKVRFRPDSQDEYVVDSQGNKTGFSPQYSIMGVYIKVGQYEQATPLTAVGNWSNVLDFSNAFTKTCASSDANCRQDVEITVYRPNYDYWCLNWGMYCDHTRVYESHPWHGQLEIQTDDTRELGG